MRFLTKTFPGISIDLNKDTFHVYEVDEYKKIVNPDYKINEKGSQHVYVLKKINWSTDTVIKKLSYLSGIPMKYWGFAGMKDKNATTFQRITVPKKLTFFSLKDTNISYAGTRIKKLRMGDLWGNLFHIYHPEIKQISPVLSELPSYFLNYFGSQRFGRSCINIKVGLLLLKNKFEEALYTYLTTPRENDPEILNIRKAIAQGELVAFPKSMKHENWIVGKLKERKTPKKILLELPRNFSLMFIHSVQSYIFNKELDLRYDNNEITETGLLVGYETQLTTYHRDILNSLNLSQEDFRMKSLPTLRAKGGKRPFLQKYYNLSLTNKLEFMLPKGSYATIFLNELVKNYETSNCDKLNIKDG